MSLKTDIHHIFPEKWSKSHGISPTLFNSIINKTPLAADTNRAIGGDAPSKYLERVASRSGLDAEALDLVLETHGVDPKALRADDFDTHFTSRKNFLLDLIEEAMGKKAQREDEHIDLDALASEYDEDALEADEDADLRG